MSEVYHSNQSCSRLRNVDSFAQPLNLSLDKEGSRVLTTALGAMTNIFLKVVVLVYAGFKANSMIERQGIKITQMSTDNFYTDFDKFTAEQGLFLAFALNVG